MYTLTYHKFGGKWFLDFPEYLDQGGREEDLECIGDFHLLLDLASDDDLNVTLRFDIAPFEGADVAILTGSSGGRSGGYYHLRRFNDQNVDLELWINKMIYLIQEDLPGRFYLKKA